MTVVLVNGNPENAAVWELLAPLLGPREVVRLSPPGFGSPVPPSTTATVESHRAWLAGELEAIGEPVHLVGHDVGGSAAMAVAMTRPELMRSWVSDSVGVFHPDYEWHALAQGWQTPGVGERSVAELLGGSLDERAARVAERTGAPAAVARRLAEAQGPEMGRAILSLYASAAQPVMARLGADLERAAQRPGLAVVGTADTFVGSVEMRRASAARAGAEVVVLPDVGHWWMLQAPELVAPRLVAFWDRVEGS